MASILIVEDTPEHQIQIRSCIDKQNEVITADNFFDALDRIHTQRYDLVILDVHLPSGNGFEICTQIRQINPEVPILFVTAKGNIIDKITGFTVGGDDYVVKPFDSRELKVRIDSKLKSARGGTLGEITFGNLRIDMTRYRVLLNKDTETKELPLTHQEFRLLLYFSQHQNKVLSRSQLLRNAWGENLSVTERTIDRHVSTLRSKIRGSRIVIEPVYKTGYLCKTL